jgi:ubiquinone/menaquinone biosynthesis C-methylase UbiE
LPRITPHAKVSAANHVIDRTLEPEVMDTAVEASDYDAMDHVEVNAAFAADFLAARGSAHRVLDIGTGTARIPILVAERAPEISFVAIDLADHMLAVAVENVRAAGLEARITIAKRDAKATGFPEAAFDAVVSNSIVHHIPEPAGSFHEMWRVLRPGGLAFVRDLLRPPDASSLARLVETYACLPTEGAPADLERHRRQRDLFQASLHAALALDEVREMLRPLGIASDAVRATSDRHWTLVARKPG